MDVEDSSLARVGGPAYPAAGQGDDPGPRRQAQSQAPACLATAVERVEEVGRLRLIEPSAAVPKPPQKLVFLQPRADLDRASGWSRLDRVANQDVGEMAQCIRWSRRRNGFVDLAG